MLTFSDGSPADVAGFKLYYADGTTKFSKLGDTFELSPATGIISVVIYYTKTYQIWVDDHFETRNYCEVFHSADFYWAEKVGNKFQFGAGALADVPPGANVFVKTGQLLPDADFYAIYNSANDDRIF